MKFLLWTPRAASAWKLSGVTQRPNTWTQALPTTGIERNLGWDHLWVISNNNIYNCDSFLRQMWG